MTTRILIAALALMFVPAIASADRYRDGGTRYRYDTRHSGHGGGHSSWGVSVSGGYGGGYYGGGAYYGRGGYYAPAYCPPPVVVRPAPVIVAPPAYYPAPCYTPAPYYAPTYYGPSYYGSGYYPSSGISFGFSYYGR